MEYPVLLSALALGLAGWLSGVLLARSQPAERSMPLAPHHAIAAAGALVVVALLTLPGRGPLHGAAGWGRGFALGGVGALLSGYAALRAAGGVNSLRWSAAVAAPCFLSLAVASAVLLWMRAAAVATLSGVAAGWFLVSLILYTGLISGRAPHTGPSGLLRIPLAVLILGVGFTSTLCATVALGHFRDVAGPQTTRWTTAAIALGAGVPVTMLLVAVLGVLAGRRAAAGSAVEALWRTLLSGALLAVLAYAISAKTLSDPRLLYATGAAVVGVVILWWLLAEGDEGAADVAQAAGRSSIQGNSVLAALLTLGTIVAGFYLLAGYGTGIVLLAAWLPAGVILTAAAAGESSKEIAFADFGETRAAERLIHLLLFGVIVVLYRLFTQRFHDDLTGALLTDHFAIFSILLGALVPSLLAGALARSPQDGSAPGRGLLRLAFVLAAALALAAGVLVLWGARGAIGLLAGLMLATIIHPEALAAMLSVGIALPLVQWAHPLLQIAAQTRAEKVRLLLWLAGVVVIALLAADYGDRLAAWTRRRRGRPTAIGVQEGAEL